MYVHITWVPEHVTVFQVTLKRLDSLRVSWLVILYEGCLLYLGIREQKQILIIENRFLFFKIFPIKIYTILDAFEPIVEALLSL